MKKEDPDNKQPEYTRYSEDEEQVLDLNELMDVQGGIDAVSYTHLTLPTNSRV